MSEIEYSIVENPESWTYTLNDLDEINMRLDAYTSSVHGDTVYIRMLDNGDIHIEGRFSIGELMTIVKLATLGLDKS